MGWLKRAAEGEAARAARERRELESLRRVAEAAYEHVAIPSNLTTDLLRRRLTEHNITMKAIGGE